MACPGLILAKAAEERKRQIPEPEQKEAERRFLSFLTSDQRRMYRDYNKIHIIGQDGNKYLLKCSKHHANIYLLVNGKKVNKWCVYVDHDVPWCDNLLAQKLALEANIEFLRSMSIITPVKIKQRAGA